MVSLKKRFLATCHILIGDAINERGAGAYKRTEDLNRRKFFALGIALGAISMTTACTTLAAEPTPDAIHIYGPGGPAPAMKAAAKIFEQRTGASVSITAGPLPLWRDAALVNADIIFSGSENMMTEFTSTFEGSINPTTIEPLFLRPSTILVRPGNPKAIAGIRSLAAGNNRIMVVAGAGQIGMWEDVAARSGDLDLLARFRGNIVTFADNSGAALERWKSDQTIDAWLIWNHWQIANSDIADQVAVEPDLTIWRPMDVALTYEGQGKADARDFIRFLGSAEGEAIFASYGWKR